MAWSEDTVRAVWNKATVVAGCDANRWRQDQCGAWIGWNEYGNRNSAFGWEIDHITPKSKGGSDSLYNLRPLQWQNNAAKQDGRLSCVVKASGNKNITV